jgi:putative ABC transport system permease protein
MEQINHRIFTILDKEIWQISTLATLDSLKARETEMERVDLIYIVFLAMFLIFTALLGLTGIFSFNINKRKPEIGVLRAIGSSQSQLQWRLVMEMVFISLLGILPAIFFLAQVPMLKFFPLRQDSTSGLWSATLVFLVAYW